MLEKIFVFGFVGEKVVEVDLQDIVDDWWLCIDRATENGAELVFKPDGERRSA